MNDLDGRIKAIERSTGIRKHPTTVLECVDAELWEIIRESGRLDEEFLATLSKKDARALRDHRWDAVSDSVLQKIADDTQEDGEA